MTDISAFKSNSSAAVLITGGAGFIGSSLADRLIAAGRKVIVIDNFSPYYDVRIKEKNVSANKDNPAYKLYRCDIEDSAKLSEIFSSEKIGCVIHLAARAGVRPSIDSSLEYVKTNVLGTANILEQMRLHGIKKLIFASSSSVYGNCKAEKFSEDLKISEPVSPYAATKSACEQLCYTWHSLYGIDCLCLRFFTVYGPRQRPDLAINKFARLMKAGKPIEMYGDGSAIRDYTYIGDILNGIESAMDYCEKKGGYEIINLGGGNPITLKNMIMALEHALGLKAEIKQLPDQPGDVKRTACDCHKAEKLLGYRAATSFDEGLRQFVKWAGLAESKNS